MTTRREFLIASGAGILALPRTALAQRAERPPRVGVLLFSSPEADAQLPSFRQGLRELGYVEGRNIALEYRFAAGDAQRLPGLAAELAGLNPQVIFALGGDVTPSAKRATRTIPIVMVSSLDPVAGGLISNLARPDANITGVTLVSAELAGKRLQFLKEIMPRLSRAGVVWNPNHPDREITETQAAGRTLAVQVRSLEVKNADDFANAFKEAARARVEALVVATSRLTLLNHMRLIDFAARHRLPLAAGFGTWARDGGLLSYGPDINGMVRRAAIYVDKILKGAKPADLPVEQPTQFELVINLKAARALGLSVPQSLLLRADQIID